LQVALLSLTGAALSFGFHRPPRSRLYLCSDHVSIELFCLIFIDLVQQQQLCRLSSLSMFKLLVVHPRPSSLAVTSLFVQRACAAPTLDG
jgi:hypothetical protein